MRLRIETLWDLLDGSSDREVTVDTVIATMPPDEPDDELTSMIREATVSGGEEERRRFCELMLDEDSVSLPRKVREAAREAMGWDRHPDPLVDVLSTMFSRLDFPRPEEIN